MRPPRAAALAARRVSARRPRGRHHPRRPPRGIPARAPHVARRAALWYWLRRGLDALPLRRPAVRRRGSASTAARGARAGCPLCRRTLVKAPAFTAVVLVTLGLGIGANTAIFSALNAVLLKPLPYPHAERLVMLVAHNPALGIPSSNVSAADFIDWQREARSFEGLAAFSGFSTTMPPQTPDGAAERIAAAEQTNLFTVLGVPPAAGRDFGREDVHPGAATASVVSHGLWQRRYRRRRRGDRPRAPARFRAPRSSGSCRAGSPIPARSSCGCRRTGFLVRAARQPAVRSDRPAETGRHRRAGAGGARHDLRAARRRVSEHQSRLAGSPRSADRFHRRRCQADAAPPAGRGRPGACWWRAPTSPTCSWRTPPGGSAKSRSAPRSAPGGAHLPAGAHRERPAVDDGRRARHPDRALGPATADRHRRQRHSPPGAGVSRPERADLLPRGVDRDGRVVRHLPGAAPLPLEPGPGAARRHAECRLAQSDAKGPGRRRSGAGARPARGGGPARAQLPRPAADRRRLRSAERVDDEGQSVGRRNIASPRRSRRITRRRRRSCPFCRASARRRPS